jgi:hypothetical protein
VAMRRQWPTGDEPAVLASPRRPPPPYHLFAVFDGHNGTEAARFAAHSVAPAVEVFLPPWCQTQAALVAEPGAALGAQVQQALVLACAELHRQFAGTGHMAGCTATIALQVRLEASERALVECKGGGGGRACSSSSVSAPRPHAAPRQAWQPSRPDSRLG